MGSFTKDEKRLVEYARADLEARLKKRRAAGLLDTLVSYAMSESGKIYSGSPTNFLQVSSCVHAEMMAIGNMRNYEGDFARVKCILIAGPVPKDDLECTKPCGICRLFIYENGTAKTTVICTCYVRKKSGWDFFPRMEKYLIGRLYPYPYRDVWRH
ncbi:MAG: hypothetical protein WC588_05405 [Candidatus Micrarchaeia archaeon]